MPALSTSPHPILILLFPPLPSHIKTMNPISVSCLRCTDICRECVLPQLGVPRCPALCFECEAAGFDKCLFPPSIRLHDQISKTACLSCTEHHHKCIFLDANDPLCTRCHKRGLPCVFELKGKYYILDCLYYILFVDPRILIISCRMY